MSERDARMIQLALTWAQKAADLHEVPVGAVVYRGDEVLACAHNRRELDSDPAGHAEIVAMRQAAARLGTWRLDGCGLAVTLEPCPMCAGAMVNARLGEVVYGTTDPKMGCVDTLHHLCTEPRFNHRLAVRSGVLANDCAKLLRDFFQARRGPEPPIKPTPAP